jgi:hypothetical protein
VVDGAGLSLFLQDFVEDVDGDIVPGSRSGRDTGPGLAWGSWGGGSGGELFGS